MSYEIRLVGNATVVDILGPIDVTSARDIGEYLDIQLRRFPKMLVLNIEGVSYTASSGLAMFLAALKKSKELRVPFGICSLSPTVKKTVEATGLHQVLPIYVDVEEACRKLLATII